jgi:succinate dehydrogenase/fumarate reductase flavoprotein subunit
MKHEFDVLVIGSGAAGFSAAIAAHDSGLKVLMVEKAEVFGGTTAYSAGVVWVPCSDEARDAGISDTPERALEYLRSESGGLLDDEKAKAFLANAPKTLRYLTQHTHVKFDLAPTWSDYHPTLPGGHAGGRSLSPQPFDGRKLGKWFGNLRWPLRSMMGFGGMSIGRSDVPHLYAMQRKLGSAVHMAGLILRYGVDRIAGWPRGTRLVNGNALIAMLALSAKERRIPIWLDSPLVELRSSTQGEVIGAMIRHNGALVVVNARFGIVLACGGQAASTQYQSAYEHVQKRHEHFTVVPPGNTGDAVRAASAVGAAVDTRARAPAAWTPVSLLPMSDGSIDRFPHFVDRGKPGFIAVDPRGKRFVNEARSYHDFVSAMIDTCKGLEQTEAYLLCDSKTLRRFGIGAVPPWPSSPKPYERTGYLLKADTLAELAAKMHLGAGPLEHTVLTFNRFVAAGKDDEFGRGSDVYQHFNGSSLYLHENANPNLATICDAPFYAVRLVAGDIGSFIGLKVNGRAQVLDGKDEVIPGLYAAGNDITSIMGGTYPGAGITIGPALTFGLLASIDIARRANLKPAFEELA